MKGIVCKVCGYISINGLTPDKCPVCGAPASAFLEKGDAIKTAADPASPTEAERKHIPSIVVVRKCGLIPDGCMDAHVKVGEIQHPMTDEHYISRLDFYIDSEYISRIYLTPRKVNPAAALHLKAGSGKLSVIESCNLHGEWINEIEL